MAVNTYATNDQYVISYEDHGDFVSSRWRIEGINSKAAGNTYGGWLFLEASSDGTTITLNLYKDRDLESADKVLTGTVTEANVAVAGGGRADRSEANDSGLGGSVYLDEWTEDPDAASAVLVTLITDVDLAELWHEIDSLPADVYDTTSGMAKYCVAATKKVLLLASQLFADHLGGYGGKEHPHIVDVDRTAPDWRRIATPDQLKEAAACWALEMAFRSCVQTGDRTNLYGGLAEKFEELRKDAIAGWNLTFTADPDTSAEADSTASAGAIRMTRV